MSNLQGEGRRLAAIMFADMVGYSARMQESEPRAIAAVRSLWELVRPILVEHGGREVDLAGDGMLMEFPGALAAVRCGLKIQFILHEKNKALPASDRILIRAGVHLGDIEHKDGRIYGDGINIAARLLPLSPSGAMVLSAHVRDQIHNVLEHPIEKLGTKTLKNIKTPLEIWCLAGPDCTPAALSSARASIQDESIKRKWAFGAAVLDEQSLELSVDGQAIELEKEALDILIFLLHHAGEVVTKDEVLEAVWSGRALSETDLSQCIFQIRKALKDQDHSQIKTVHGFGYRLAVPVKVEFVATNPEASFDFKPGDKPPLRPLWSLVERLGTGGHGEAWLARHDKTREPRVFKFALETVALASLKREITLFRVLKDSLGDRADYVQILDWNLEEMPYFLESEHVNQGNLAQWLQKQGGAQSLPLTQRLELIAAIAEALAAAHSVGVLHKDLKPTNVLIQEEQGRHSIKLCDFGSGGVLDPERLEDMGITRMGFTKTVMELSGTTSGTPLYMAPEVISGQPITALADIYSLGVMLYQIVVGNLHRPLSSGWESDVEDELLREDIALAAHGNPSKRLPEPSLLAQRLRSLEQRRAQRKQREKRRRFWERIQIAGAAIAVVAALAGIWQWQQAERGRERQERHIANLLELGRLELDGDRRARAAVYLHAAYAVLPVDDSRLPALRFRLARAMEPVDTAITSASLVDKDVEALKVLADGTRLVTSSSRNGSIWDTASLKQIAVLEPPSFEVDAMRDPVLSGDGRRLARIAEAKNSKTKYAVVWDAASGRRLLEAPGLSIEGVAFSGDGKILAVAAESSILTQVLEPDIGPQSQLPTGSASSVVFAGQRELIIGGYRGKVELWSLGTGQRLRSFDGLKGDVTALALSPDGRLLLAGTEQGEVRLWTLKSGNAIATAGHKSKISTLGWNASGARYLTASLDSVRVWDAADGRLLLNIADPSVDDQARAKLSADGNLLFHIMVEGLAVWGVDTGNLLYVLDGHAEKSSAFDLSSADGRLFMAGADGRLTVWDSKRRSSHSLIHDPRPLTSQLDSGVYSAEFDDSAERVMTAGSDGRVRVWRASDGQLLNDWLAHKDGAVNARFLDPHYAISSGSDGALWLWNLESGLGVPVPQARHRGGVGALDVTPSSQFVVTRSDDVTHIWERDERLLLRPALTDLSLKSAATSTDGTSLIVVTTDGAVQSYDSSSGEVRWRYCGEKPQASGACVAGSTTVARGFGPWIFNRQDNGLRYLRDTASGAVHRWLPDEFFADAGSADMSEDGRYVLLCSDHGTAWLRGLETEEVHELTGHKGSMRVCERPVDDVAYTGGEEGTVVAWDADSGERLGVVARHSAGVSFARLNPQGDRLVTASFDNTGALWSVGREQRSAETIEKLLRCHVPWTLTGNELVPATPDPAVCLH